MNMIDPVKQSIRRKMDRLAANLDKLTDGAITPNGITITSFAGHFAVGYLIIFDYLIIAGLCLIVFGLMDALDGALARHKKIASTQGMFFDASTDRLKEVVLYSACALYFSRKGVDTYVVWCVLACGVSLSISYVKAKGEAAIASLKHIPHQTLNRLFQDGLAGFEVRMTILIAGLLTGLLGPALVVITVIGLFTLTQRFIRIYKHLGHVQD